MSGPSRGRVPRGITATPDWSRCVCGKRGFLKKADAKRERRGHRDRTHLGAYRCDQAVGPYRWHLGHKPTALIRGEISRDEIGPRRRTAHTHRDDAVADHELAEIALTEDEGDHVREAVQNSHNVNLRADYVAVTGDPGDVLAALGRTAARTRKATR